MMDKEWSAVLRRYGQTVTVYGTDLAQGETVRAFLQPILEQGKEQLVPSPLGLRREERVLYLGPRDVMLTAGESHVDWQGQRYEVQSARPVGGESPHHWWALLRPRDKEGA